MPYQNPLLILFKRHHQPLRPQGFFGKKTCNNSLNINKLLHIFKINYLLTVWLAIGVGGYSQQLDASSWLNGLKKYTHFVKLTKHTDTQEHKLCLSQSLNVPTPPQANMQTETADTILYASSRINCLNSTDPNQLNIITLDRSLIFLPEQYFPEPFSKAQLSTKDSATKHIPALQQPSDIWQRIRAGMTLEHSIKRRRTKMQFNWYAKHPAYMDRVAQRAERYMYYIVEELERRNMPMEFALLPIVESAFDPFAYSHGRAAGIWQFIPSTGKMFGLKQNWWYDGRRDIVASTNAALDYLQNLNNKFDGDWLLALAAYNSGQSKVQRAINANQKQGKPVDFWSLKLPKETRAYVPKMLALGELVLHADKYAMPLRKINDIPYFKAVETKGQLDLAKASEMADISMDELYRLNPGFNRWATDPDGPHQLLVPVTQAQKLEIAINNLDPNQRVSWIRHTIKPGQSLISIANKYNTRPEVLTHINKVKGHLIRAGKTLMVPIAQFPLENYVLSATSRLASIQARTPASVKRTGKTANKISYKVRQGDSFWSIARKHGISSKKLARWNGMGIRDTLRIGQEMVIWKSINEPLKLAYNGLPNREPIIRKVGYRVRPGDSLVRIAGKFNVRISDIEKWNTLNRKKYLQPGQPLTLFVDTTNVN